MIVGTKGVLGIVGVADAQLAKSRMKDVAAIGLQAHPRLEEALGGGSARGDVGSNELGDIIASL